MLTGCIPVFVGPPYHSLPFIDDLDGLDYRDASFVLNITNHSAWLPEPMHVWLPPANALEHRYLNTSLISNLPIKCRAFVSPCAGLRIMSVQLAEQI